MQERGKNRFDSLELLFIYTRELTRFTVGVGIPSFFMEYEGSFGSKHP